MPITLDSYPGNIQTTAANRQAVGGVNFEVNLAVGLPSLFFSYGRAIGRNSSNTDPLTGDELLDGSFPTGHYPEGPFNLENINTWLDDAVTQNLLSQAEADDILQDLKDFVAAGRELGMKIHALREGLGLTINPVVASSAFTS